MGGKQYEKPQPLHLLTWWVIDSWFSLTGEPSPSQAATPPKERITSSRCSLGTSRLQPASAVSHSCWFFKRCESVLELWAMLSAGGMYLITNQGCKTP